MISVNQVKKNCGEDKEELITQLNERLINCTVENRSVAIHLHTGKVITRISIIPDSVNIDSNEFYLEYRSCYLSVDHGIDYIEYVDDYDYDSYYVRIDKMEMFFDFI